MQAVWCLTGHESGLVKLTMSRVDRGACHAHFLNHSAAVTGIGLSADERVAITVSLDSSLALTDLDSGKSFHFRWGAAACVHESVTCCGTEVMCGSARHSTEIGDDTGLRSPLTGLQTASQIGATVVAATSTDGTVPLWSVRGNSVEPISKISVRALGRRATSAAWTADGNTVVVGCVDGTVSKWDLRNTQVHMLS